MHYKNGKEAREGDPVICRPDDRFDYTIAGKLHTLSAQAATCNGYIAVPIPGGVKQELINIRDCLHAGDAFSAVDVKAPETLPKAHFVCWLCKQKLEGDPAYSSISVIGTRFDYCAECWERKSD